MTKKKNSKYETILKDLENYVRDCQESGEIRIPSEPKLAEVLGTSRMTLRKAIQVLCERDILQKTHNGTFISESLAKKKKKGSILFLSGGYKGVFGLYTIERIWHSVNTLAMAENIDINLLLINEAEDLAETIKQIKSSKANLIVLGIIDPRVAGQVFELLNKKQSPVISLTQFHRGSFSRIICLGNYQAGRLAAEALLKAGYKRPFFVESPRHGKSYLPFEERFRGFTDVLEENSISTDDIRPDSRTFKQEDYAVIKRDIISKYRKKGYDSVFIYSDENCDIILKDEFLSKSIPNQLGVITIDGGGYALRHNPPVACVSHAVEGIASEVIKKANDCFKDRLDDEFEIHIKPEVINTTTLKRK